MIYTVTLNPSIDRTLHLSELRIGDLNRADSVETHLAGKGVNVSVALSRLDQESVLLGFAGGATGHYLAEGLRLQGFRCDWQQVEGETRSNLTLVDDALGQITKLNEPGPTVSEEDVEALLERMRGLAEGDLCVLSGSLPPGARSDVYARLVRAIRSQGAYVVLDTSGEALMNGLAACPDLIKPNRDEAQDIIGCDLATLAGWIRAARMLRESGAGAVLLSLGERGALFVGDSDAVWAKAPSVKVASPVGAGDALLAGWLDADQRGVNRAGCLRWAVACGTAAAMLDGSLMPTRDAVEAIWSKVEMHALSDHQEVVGRTQAMA